MPSRQHEGQRQQQHIQNHDPVQIKLHDVEIQELLDSPVGSFRPSTWLQAQRFIQYLSEKEQDIPRAFQILDRLVREPDSRARMTNDMVYLVVRQWLNLYVEQQRQFGSNKKVAHSNRNYMNASAYKSSSNIKNRNVPPVFPPLAVWRKIDAYMKAGIALTSSTCHKIIEGTAHAKANEPHSPQGPLLAETILDRMMSQSKHKNPLLRPSAITFIAVLVSWEAAASHSPIVAAQEAPQKSLAILQKLKTLYESNWGSEFLPNRNAYRSVMNIFARCGDGEQVEALLEELYSLYLDHSEDQSRQRKQPYLQRHDGHLLLPTSPFFSLVLYAWSRSRDPMAAERAEAILDRMLELEASGEIPNLQVSPSCFNIVMVCYSRRRTAEAAIKAQSLYDRLLDLQKRDEAGLIDAKKRSTHKIPTGGTYCVMINTWARFDPAKADNVFWEWTEEYKKGNCDMRVDMDLLRTLVAAWCHASRTVTDSAERIDRLIEFAVQIDGQGDNRNPPVELVEPTVAIFNMSISAWCRKNTLDGIRRAEERLYQMQSYHEAHPQSDMSSTVLSYLPIVQSLATLGKMERAEELVAEYFTRHGGDAAAIRRRGDRSSNSTDLECNGIEYLNTRIVNIVLYGWLSKARAQPEAAIRAEDLLLTMKSFGSRPNAASFQYVLDAWRKCMNRSNAQYYQKWHQRPPQVDQVLTLLDQEQTRGRLGEDEKLYLTLKQGWAMLAV